MAVDRRVMWLEGAFLRPQHFQQQDRRAAGALADRAAMAQPFHWGFSSLALDEAALGEGRVRIARCAGAFQDGEPFSFPGDVAVPPSVALPLGSGPATIRLIVPEASAAARIGARAGAEGKAPGTRYVIEDVETVDALSPQLDTAPVELGTCNARLTADENTDGFHALTVARVLEVTGDNRVVLDPDFIPPSTALGVATPLGRIVDEVAVMLAARADALAGGESRIGAASNAAVIELMMLRTVNGHGAAFDAFRAAGCHHPETIHRAAAVLAAELASFATTGGRRAARFPGYDHDDIAACFAPIVLAIRASLGEIIDRDAYPLDLKRGKNGGYFGAIAPGDLVPDGDFIVIARASMDEAAFRDAFPRQTTVSSVNQIRDYVRTQDRGATLEPLSVTPQQLRPMAGWTYFRIRHDAEPWADITATKTIAVYEANAFPDLEIQIWGIRT